MRYLNSSRREAFTLIEVVASLLLVGTLLVAVMTGHRKLVNQSRLAQERIVAVKVLDNLLSNASRGGVDPFVQRDGKVPGDNPYSWRTILREDTAASQLGAVIVRIELTKADTQSLLPLAAVEVLRPHGNEGFHAR